MEDSYLDASWEDRAELAFGCHLDDRDYGDDCSEHDGEPDERDEPWDGFRDDVEADADALASAGFGTDEDYGCYGGGEEY